MKVIKRYNQHRRDLDIDVKCEGCGHEVINGHGAYDDRNYWDNVVPNFKCEKCGESTKTLGLEKETIPTKYPEGLQL